MANVIVASAQSPKGPEPSPEPIREVDAYAIYAMLLPRAWSNNSREAMLLQQETVPNSLCSHSKGASDADWPAVQNNYKAENLRVRLLLKDVLKLEIPYRLIARAEISADDGRLRRKYPGTWQRLPESMEYAYVSAVGFNPNKTRAIVYVGLRNKGTEYWLEKHEGRWVVAPFGCSWIA